LWLVREEIEGDREGLMIRVKLTTDLVKRLKSVMLLRIKLTRWNIKKVVNTYVISNLEYIDSVKCLSFFVNLYLFHHEMVQSFETPPQSRLL
jgi:hypothetical protein